MKKFLMVMGFILLLSACDTSSADDKEVIDIDEPVLSSSFEYTINNYDGGSSMDRYFDATFSNVRYTPFTNDVCVSVSISDTESANAVYYLILQEQGQMRTLQQVSFYGGGTSACFDAWDSSGRYEILIGKVDGDDLNPTSYIEGVASVTFRDKDYDNRSRVGDFTFSVMEIPEYYLNALPEAVIDLDIADPGKAITEVKFLLYEREFGTLVESVVHDVSERSASTIYLRTKRFTELAPNEDYVLKVVVTGNDGFDDFSNVVLLEKSFETPGMVWNPGITYHNLFTQITGVELTDEGLVVSYFSRNNETVVSSSNNEPYQIVFEVRDAEGNVKVTHELDSSINEMLIPDSTIGYGDVLFVVTDKDNITLSYIDVQEKAPVLAISAIENGSYRVTVLNGLDRIDKFYLQLNTTKMGAQNYETIYGGGTDWIYPTSTVFQLNIENNNTVNAITHYSSLVFFYHLLYTNSDGVERVVQGEVVVQVK